MAEVDKSGSNKIKENLKGIPKSLRFPEIKILIKNSKENNEKKKKVLQ